MTDGPIRVLHVDDDPAFADLAATLLEREADGFAVDTATAASEGLARLTATDHAVDCVVSDYEMPGTDGIEFLEAVREVHPELPFILYTGAESEAVVRDAIAAGATDHLRKRGPASQYPVLADRIRNAVDGAR